MKLALLPVPGATATPPALRRMRIVATALLLAMAILFLVARALGDRHPAWGFVRAFAEAAMVGGLILSTVLTLLIVPASFSLAVGIEKWLGPKLGRRLLTYRPGDDGSTVIEGPGHPRPIGYGGGPQPAE